MLEIIRGDDVELEFVFTDDNGDPVDLTDGEIFFTVKKYVKDEDVILYKDFDFSGDGKKDIS
jgi:hypothetical protein